MDRQPTPEAIEEHIGKTIRTAYPVSDSLGVIGVIGPTMTRHVYLTPDLFNILASKYHPEAFPRGANTISLHEPTIGNIIVGVYAGELPQPWQFDTK